VIDEPVDKGCEAVAPDCRQVLINASDLSDARFRRNAKLGNMFRAFDKSLKVAAGGLRRMR
jgi:hypothetical protein